MNSNKPSVGSIIALIVIVIIVLVAFQSCSDSFGSGGGCVSWVGRGECVDWQ
ncbi:MAG: hypothetical protein RLZZ600_293 [Actinomycetota bacterium]|jgi:hypothetical protein